MIPLLIFLWFYFLIGIGASLRVFVDGIETGKSLSKTVFGTVFVVIAWPYMIGVRLIG